MRKVIASNPGRSCCASPRESNQVHVSRARRAETARPVFSEPKHACRRGYRPRAAVGCPGRYPSSRLLMHETFHHACGWLAGCVGDVEITTASQLSFLLTFRQEYNQAAGNNSEGNAYIRHSHSSFSVCTHPSIHLPIRSGDSIALITSVFSQQLKVGLPYANAISSIFSLNRTLSSCDLRETRTLFAFSYPVHAHQTKETAEEAAVYLALASSSALCAKATSSHHQSPTLPTVVTQTTPPRPPPPHSRPPHD